MSEELEQRIRYTLQEADSVAAPHELPAPSQVWSRLQFRLAYRPRRETYASHASTILVAVYLLAFLMWSAWSTWLNSSLIGVLALAAAAAVFLCMHVSRKFRS
jgi:fatty acid desaturase